MSEKYITSIALMNKVLASDNGKDATKDWDELYTYVLENFAEPGTAHVYKDDALSLGEYVNQFAANSFRKSEVTSARNILTADSESLIKSILALPPVLAEAIFPVAVARYLLGHCKLNVNLDKSTTFTKFYFRYSEMIVDSMSTACNSVTLKAA